MIYEDISGIESLSALGMGCYASAGRGMAMMPDINVPEAEAEWLPYAMEKGVNYYDTAWGYHDGNSERVMGEVLCGVSDERTSILQPNFPDMI